MAKARKTPAVVVAPVTETATAETTEPVIETATVEATAPVIETENAEVAAPAVDAEKVAEVDVVEKLVVRSLVAGFRRGGRAWPAEEVTVNADEFTAEQLAQILAEPKLVVLPVAGGVA